MRDSKAFIYRDAAGHIAAYEVSTISRTESHFQGISGGQLKTFRYNRVLEWLGDLASPAARQAHWRAHPPAAESRKSEPLPPDVCFTGFRANDKKRLKQVAEAAGLVVRAGVTQDLYVLCCGYNAGPAKMLKARNQGALALDEAQFLAMLETGEVPDPA